MNIHLALDEQPWNVAATIKLLCLALASYPGSKGEGEKEPGYEAMPSAYQRERLAANIIGKGSLVQYT